MKRGMFQDLNSHEVAVLALAGLSMSGALIGGIAGGVILGVCIVLIVVMLARG